MIDKDVADAVETMDRTLQGQTHLFCALATALERSGVLDRETLKSAINEKIRWLEHHNVDLEVAVPLLQAKDWLTTTPPNPKDPFEGRSRDYLRPVPRK